MTLVSLVSKSLPLVVATFIKTALWPVHLLLNPALLFGVVPQWSAG